MKPFAALLSFFLMAFAGCSPPDDGFRFDAEYSADRSGFLVRLVSAGVRAPDGHEGEAFSVVQVCPSAAANGRPFRMTFTAAGNGRISVECGELGPVAMEWAPGSREGLLRGLLTSAGFRQIDPAELADCLEAVGEGFNPPAKRGGSFHGERFRTIREDLTEGHEIDHGRPPEEWVAQSEVAGCT